MVVNCFLVFTFNEESCLVDGVGSSVMQMGHLDSQLHTWGAHKGLQLLKTNAGLDGGEQLIWRASTASAAFFSSMSQAEFLGAKLQKEMKKAADSLIGLAEAKRVEIKKFWMLEETFRKIAA